MKAIIDGDVIVYSALYRGIDLKAKQQKFDEVMKEIIEITFSSSHESFLGGKKNYRKEYNPNYKANRTKPKPDHYHAIRDHAIKEWGAIVTEGQEADDAVSISAHKSKDKSENYIIVSIDKDLKQVVGPYYNPTKRTFFYTSEDEAEIFLFEQALTGDSVDNIFGIYGVGEVKAKKFLLGTTNTEERLNRVIGTWKFFYPDDWEERMLLCLNGIYIRRRPNEYITSLADFREFISR